MPDIQLIGFTRRDFPQEAARIRRLLRDAPYKGNFAIVWFDSISESVEGAKPKPFLRIQGRPSSLDDVKRDLVARLTKDYEIEIAHNLAWFARSA